MHPLLRRLLIRGPFIFLAVAGLAWLMGYLAESYFEGLQRGSTGSILWSVTQFGLIGFVIYAVLEWISFAREKSTKAKVDAKP